MEYFRKNIIDELAGKKPRDDKNHKNYRYKINKITKKFLIILIKAQIKMKKISTIQ